MRNAIVYVLEAAGAASVVAGVALVFVPAALVVAGALLVAISYTIDR